MSPLLSVAAFHLRTRCVPDFEPEKLLGLDGACTSFRRVKEERCLVRTWTSVPTL